jgi:hypothetical protein
MPTGAPIPTVGQRHTTLKELDPMTLHEFVLNLISDPHAQADFEADPHACLSAAGLTDVTPADVRDAIPLVADYAPARVAGLTSGLPDLTSATLQRGDGVLPLQPLTAGLAGTGLSNGNLSLAAVSGGAHTGGDVGPFGYSGGAHVGATEHGVDGSGGFSTTHDPGATLDSGAVTGTVGHTVGTVTGSLDPGHGLTGPLDHGGLLDTVHGVVPGLDVPGLDSVPGLGGGTGLDGVTGGLDGVTGGLDGLTGGLDGLTGLHGTTGLLGGTDPLHLSGSGSASTSVHGDADTGGGLHLPDVTHLL